MSARLRRVGVVVAIVAAVVAATGLGIRFGRDRPPVDDGTPRAAVATPCDADAQCVGPRHAAAAARACKAGIEDLAGFGVRWADPAGGPRFDRYAWRDRAPGILTFSGDAAEFANATGAYQPVNYACDFDPVAGTVVAARVQPGRLP